VSCITGSRRVPSLSPLTEFILSSRRHGRRVRARITGDFPARQQSLVSIHRRSSVGNWGVSVQNGGSVSPTSSPQAQLPALPCDPSRANDPCPSFPGVKSRLVSTLISRLVSRYTMARPGRALPSTAPLPPSLMPSGRTRRSASPRPSRRRSQSNCRTGKGLEASSLPLTALFPTDGIYLLEWFASPASHPPGGIRFVCRLSRSWPLCDWHCVGGV
jgi:hypothetical protein